MARVARLRRCNVRGGFAPRRAPVVAGRAAPGDHPGVVHRGGRPSGGPMAGIAGSSRRNVRGRLTSGRAAIVTGYASTRRHARMTEGRRSPGRGPVTAIAARTGWDMRRRLTGRPASVMAGYTGTRSHTCMVITCRGQDPIGDTHAMTGIARSRRNHMSRGLASSLNTVVTGHARAGDNAEMPEGCAGPRNRPMAIFAGHGCWNVRCGLPLHRAVVMTLRTTSRSDTIVRKKRRLPARCTVTAVAIHRGRQVVGRLKR